ncbi:MAG: Hsp20/alpha crystallin family protein [Candidatus Eremiobacteraeota bacterium]|nr:Hsp20/alpha crystallin family protein [Candidatus Eremiobacteraeota bacterium]
MNNLTTGNDRLQVTRGPVTFRPVGDLWNLDPFRNFFSNAPAVAGLDINRTDQGYVVEIPVAGYKPGDIDITVENGLLAISGKSEKRSFTRSFLLPDEVNDEDIDAKVEHGMLTLNLKLLPKAQPKKISIKAN